MIDENYLESFLGFQVSIQWRLCAE